MLVGLIVFLVLLAGVQAALLFPLLSELASEDEPGFEVDVNLPERTVRVFADPGDRRLLLKTPLDLPEADEKRARELDAALFPGGDAHRYFLLHASNRGAAPTVLDLAETPLVLEDENGRSWQPLDLGTVLARREKDLPEYLRLFLRLHLPEDGRLNLPPGASRDVLLAYPGEVEPSRVARARRGDVLLEPEELRKDDLDRLLEKNGRR